MANLRKCKNEYMVSLRTLNLSKHLLSASMSAVCIAKRKLKIKSHAMACSVFLAQLSKSEIKKPNKIIVCGSDQSFCGTFNKIPTDECDLIAGRKIKGTPYKELDISAAEYSFQLMNFFTGEVEEVNLPSVYKKFPIELERYNKKDWIFHKDTEQLARMFYAYVLCYIQYQEQMHRVSFMSQLVKNCTELVKKNKNKYFKARQNSITNGVLLSSMNFNLIN